jgi:hypothetical protein
VVIPSPTPPPFGYCSGLRTTDDARYITSGGYFAALGNYGVYAIHGHHAYRTCNDFSGNPPHLVRHGITTVRGLTRLFSRALGEPPD